MQIKLPNLKTIISKPLSRNAKLLISLVLAMIIGVNIYFRSDAPPYGHPYNELSDNYWGLCMDVYYRWQSMDFALWNRGIGGGMSLFSSGQYPLLNPTNALAWVTAPDQFFLIKLVEPYVIGIFLMMFLLWHGFGTRWYVALFGGLAFMGLPFSRHTTMVESPVFLYGIALLPGMVMIVKKWQHQVPLAGVGIGASLAVMFLTEGVAQLPQMLVWWAYFFFFLVFLNKGETPVSVKYRALLTSIALMFFFTITLSAIQLLPTFYYYKFESSRLPGSYTINSYPLWGIPADGGVALIDTIYAGLVTAGSMRMKVFSGFVLIAIGLAATRGRQLFSRESHGGILLLSVLATVFYFCTPSVAETAARIFPALAKLFAPLTSINFRYGLHTLDFCLVLFLCLLLKQEREAAARSSIGAKVWTWSWIGLAIVVAVLPVVLVLFSDQLHGLRTVPLVESFVPSTLKKGAQVLIYIGAFLFALFYKGKPVIKHGLLIVFLTLMGFMMTLECFKWHDKGSNYTPEKFQVGSPEREYFMSAKGKYILPFERREPAWTSHNFNLVHGVHGTSGFLSLSPYRVINFVHAYNHRNDPDGGKKFPVGNPRFMYFDGPLSPALASYFPVDFTMVNKNSVMTWPGFHRVLAGDEYDVYERVTPAERIFFADKIEVMPLQDLVKRMDAPRGRTVFVEEGDMKFLSGLMSPGVRDARETRYSDFLSAREDRISFQVHSPADVIAVVPERYQKGWELRVNGTPVQIFPANYLFIGALIPAGGGLVEMRFVPPLLGPGIWISIAALFFLILIFKRAKKFR